jgi:adenosylmethionine-8-amino-7-oxononanoate aminotransferase
MAARGLGAVLRPLGDTVVLNPPLAMTLEEARRLVQITGDAIDEVMGGSA